MYIRKQILTYILVIVKACLPIGLKDRLPLGYGREGCDNAMKSITVYVNASVSNFKKSVHLISQYQYTKPATIGSPVKRHLIGISLADWWWPDTECWLDSFVIFQEGPYQ